MLQLETWQCGDTIILEDLIRMSREHNIAVTVFAKGKEYCGKIKGFLDLHESMLYLREKVGVQIVVSIGNTSRVERECHRFVPVSDIESIEFHTDVGFLDDLIE